MNVVLDTNVFISGIFFAGPPHRILQAWRDEAIQLIVSLEILGFRKKNSVSWLQGIRQISLVIPGWGAG